MTWEGDNNILYLQTGRFLIKSLAAVVGGKSLEGASRYLHDIQSEMSRQCEVTDSGQWLDTDVQLRAFKNCAVRLIARAGEELRRAAGGSFNFEGDTWDGNTVVVIK